MATTSRSSRSSRGAGKKKGTVIKVDFTGVEASGKVEEGRQLLTVDSVELKTSDNSGNDYLNWKFKAKGGTVYHTTSLMPNSLWNLRNVLEALGQEVEEAAMDIDYSEFDGLTLGADIILEKYQGKPKPVIVDFFTESELDGEELDDDDKKGGSEEEGEELSFEDVMEMDKDDLLALAEEQELKVPVKIKRDLDKLREFVTGELGLEPQEEEKGKGGGEPEYSYEDIDGLDDIDDALEIAKELDIKVPVKIKRKLDEVKSLLIEELELEAPAKTSTRKSSRKAGTKEITKGSVVTFEDDGEELEGKVKSINDKEQFAVLDVDGEEWEVELADIKVK